MENSSSLKKDVQEWKFSSSFNLFLKFDDNFKSSTIYPHFMEMEEDLSRSKIPTFPMSQFLLNNRSVDRVECFAQEGHNVEIAAFLLWKFLLILRSSVIESLPISPIPVEDSEPVQEEIDIFLVPDDLIQPGVENDDSEDEDNELPNLDHQDDPSIPRPPPEPPDIEKCFEPEAGILITKVFKGVSKPHDFMANILPTLLTLVSDLTFILFLSFGSEDTFLTPTAFLEPAWLSREELSYALMFVQTLMKARLRFSLPFALPKDELIQGLSRACDSVTKNKPLRGSSPHAYPFLFLMCCDVLWLSSSGFLLFVVCCTDISKSQENVKKEQTPRTQETEEKEPQKEAKDAKPKPGKVKKSKLWSTSSQPWSTEVNPQKDKTSKVTTLVPQVFRNYTNGPWTLNGP
ncbi:hypothetical protein Tco_1440580 [Tanacetum coccineum]